MAQATDKQKAFYHKQRLDDDAKAEKGDLKAGKESAKIYKKLGSSGKAAKGKHLAAMERGTGEDPDKVNKIALAVIPAAAGGIGAAAGALGRAGAGAAGRAALTAGAGVARKALGAGEKTAAKAGSSVAKSARQSLARARPVKKAIGGQKSLPSNRKVSAKVDRAVESRKELPGRKRLSGNKADSKRKALKKAA